MENREAANALARGVLGTLSTPWNRIELLEVAGAVVRFYSWIVSLKEIEREALALSESDRTALIAALLDTLPDVGSDVSDEEVLKRERELDSGAVEPLSHEEFVRRVQSERGR